MVTKMKRTLHILHKQSNYQVEKKNQIKFHLEIIHQYKLINNSY